jgi:hypothetical protein
MRRQQLTSEDYVEAMRKMKPSLHGFDDWRLEELRLLPKHFWERRAELDHCIERGQGPFDPNMTVIKSPALDKPGPPSVANKRILAVTHFTHRIFMKANFKTCLKGWQ